MPADAFVSKLNEQIAYEFAASQQYIAVADPVEPIALALAQEKRVTDQINALAATARAESDYTSEQFIQWFIKEQIEEVATMSDLLRVAERSKSDVMEIEDYVAREQAAGGAADPTAPAAAG